MRRAPAAILLVCSLIASCAQENRQPTLDPIASQGVRVGETLRLLLTARDPDGDLIEFKATPKPITAYFEVVDGQTWFVWAPLISETGPNGRVHRITFTVEDGRGGLAARSVDINVKPQSNAPTFIGPQGYVLNLSEDDDIAFNVGVKDDDSAEVVFRIIGGECSDGCGAGHECKASTCQIAGSRFQALDAKTASFYWKPTAEQRDIGNYWQLVIGAKDEAHGEVTRKISILLMNGDADKNCAGSPPVFIPCQDASCVPLPDLDGVGAIVFRGQGIDTESEIREMRMHFATTNPLDPGSYAGNQVDMTRCEPLDDPSCPADAKSRYFLGVMGNPASAGTEPLLLHYYLEALDDDDIKGTGCDHITRFPKEGHFTVASYPPGWTGPCKDDASEPNQSAAEAAAIEPGVTYDLRHCAGASATDWYRLDVQPGAIVSVELLHEERHGGLQVSLHDAAGIPLAGPGELATTIPDSSPVFVRVNVPDGELPTDQTYGLVVNRTFGGCPNDDLEPNDNADQAPLVGNKIHDVVICPGDRDWLKVSAHPGESVVLDLDFQHAFGDLDLYLYSSAGELLRSSQTATSSERVVWSAIEPDTYYVEVRGYQGQTNSGKLDVRVVSTETLCFEDYLSPNHIHQKAFLLPEDVYEDLTMCSGKEDWFRVDVNAGETVFVVAEPYFPAGGTLDLLGFAPDGKTIVGSPLAPDPAVPGQVRWQAHVSEPGPFLWRLRTPGDVLVLFDMYFGVADPSGECVDDRFSPTNTVKGALDIDKEAGFVTRLKLCPGGEDWFRIQGAAFEQLFVYVYGFPSEGVLNASLHRFEGSELIHVADGEATSNGVEILHLPEENHEFYIHVTGQPGTIHHYDLVIGLQ